MTLVPADKPTSLAAMQQQSRGGTQFSPMAATEINAIMHTIALRMGGVSVGWKANEPVLIAKPGRKQAEKDFWSAWKALSDYLWERGEWLALGREPDQFDFSLPYLAYINQTWMVRLMPLPTLETLETWCGLMQDGTIVQDSGEPYTISTINARLSKVRVLLRRVAAEIANPIYSQAILNWTAIKNVKGVTYQDRTDQDFGIRLTLKELQVWVNTIDIDSLKGLRDRAIIALGAGAGLRIAEIAALTVKDVSGRENDNRIVLVRHGKGNKQRMVPISGVGAWVWHAIQAWIEAVGLYPAIHGNRKLIQGLIRLPKGGYALDKTRDGVSTVSIRNAIESYPAVHNGETVTLLPHDLRKTYARTNFDNGMKLNAVRSNLGHSSSITTERNYIGLAMDLDERQSTAGIWLKDMKQ